jgi:magnesium-transporting ATPase (P-type)
MTAVVRDVMSADPLEPLEELFRDLRASVAGLSSREAARRLEVSGPNELARQFTHPLALLLAVAAVLAWASGTPRLAIAIAAAILLNASFSYAREIQAERAVEALAAFLPERARRHLASGLTTWDLTRDLLLYIPRLDEARLRLMTGHRGHVQ